MAIVLVTGGFDPLHDGHINLINQASLMGRILVVGLNSDAWLNRKKGQPFMTWEQRRAVLESLRYVTSVFKFDDTNDTAIDAIQTIQALWHGEQILFANGGDRGMYNTPEYERFKDNPQIEFAWGVGGDFKQASSSDLLCKWAQPPKVGRPWGWWRVLSDEPGSKVKELTILPGRSLSMQRHRMRDEVWTVVEGSCTIVLGMREVVLKPDGNSLTIRAETWHRAFNPHDVPCQVVEVQRGYSCDENDIERMPQ